MIMNPEDLQSTVQKWLDSSPFIRFMGLELIEADVGRGIIAMKMPMRAEFERGGMPGQFHGGPIAALIDTVGDFAVALLLSGTVPTINFRVDYLRPSVGSFLLARATVRRQGRTVSVVDVDVFDDQQRLTAVGRGCYSSQIG
jgi:uncharacterized protein (TIGR00369 family)